MKIAILDAGTFYFDSDEPWKALREFGEVEVHQHTKHEIEYITERCRDCEMVLTNKVPLMRDTLSLLPDLKLISVLATGHNVVDSEAAREQGITVCNGPSYSTRSVAQHTLALMLELCNNVGLHSLSVQAGDWTRCPEFTYWEHPVFELTGANVGIVGWGEIAQSVGQLVRSFGANVIAYTPNRRNAPSWPDGFRWAELDELFVESDIVTLHCPQTKENTGLINRSVLRQMKRSAFLINTARGPLVDELALVEALNAGEIAGAGLDVVGKEPMLPDNPLIGAQNCFITPHLGWSSMPARLRLLEITFANVRAFLDGNPQNVVN